MDYSGHVQGFPVGLVTIVVGQDDRTDDERRDRETGRYHVVPGVSTDKSRGRYGTAVRETLAAITLAVTAVAILVIAILTVVAAAILTAVAAAALVAAVLTAAAAPALAAIALAVLVTAVVTGVLEH